MPFEVLSDEAVKKMARSRLGVAERGYRFVNLTLSVLLLAEMERHELMPNDNRPINGDDLIQMMRFTGASVYGMLAPQVFLNWGFKKDDVLRRVAKKIFVHSEIITDDPILCNKHYRGKRILQPLEDMDELEAFDDILSEINRRS